MKRNNLLQLLRQHTPSDSQEKVMLAETIAFVEAHADCFERTLLVGHVTGSAWVVDESRTMALLVHHRKLNKWFQPGGHCDGNSDVQQVAQREAEEETGLSVKALSEAIFDVDVHPIPERPNEPAHLHYDVRFLFEAASDAMLVLSGESKDLRWVPLRNIRSLNDSSSVMRMVQKTFLR